MMRVHVKFPVVPDGIEISDSRDYYETDEEFFAAINKAVEASYDTQKAGRLAMNKEERARSSLGKPLATR